MKITDIIINAVCEATGVGEKLLNYKYRGQNVVAARFILARLLKDYTCFGEKEIGCLMNRDDSTVHWYLSKFDERCLYFPGMKIAYYRADMVIRKALEDEKNGIREWRL